MSFDVDAAGGYGTGSLGDVTDPKAQINSFGCINGWLASNRFFTRKDTERYGNGMYHDITDRSIIGTEILVVSFATNSSAGTNNLGSWKVCKITDFDAANDCFYYTVDQDIQAFFNNNCLDQMITIPHFKNLTLNSGYYLTPPQVDIPNNVWYGGYVAFKCSGTLTMNGSSAIALEGRGHNSSTADSYRPLMTQEQNGTLDTDLYSGCENSIAKDHLILNRGDGTCFIMARNIVTDGQARIGTWDSQGVQYCRGATDSRNKPSNVSNIGGSTICIVCQNWTGFSPEIISKYRSTKSGNAGNISNARGLARAYIAVNSQTTSMLPDEGLYALDTVKNLRRLKSEFNIGSFGRGTTSQSYTTAPTVCLNSYAPVTNIADDGYTLTGSRLDTDAEPYPGSLFSTGRLVMVHMTQKSAGTHFENGRFFLARIVDTGTTYGVVTLNHPCTFNLNTHYVQLIAIPEFSDLTLKGTYVNTPDFYRGAGGIFAVACSSTCDLSTAVIDLTGKGTFDRFAGNALMGNMEMRAHLPLGRGNGSALILAKNLKMSSATRIGGTFSGANFGGNAVKYRASTSATPQYTPEGGYSGIDGTSAKYPEYAGSAGWGGGGGINIDDANNGGWFSNASNIYDNDNQHKGGYQGAHVMIIADTITNFNLSAISTGGMGGVVYNGTSADAVHNVIKGGDAGAGYGGGGYPRLQASGAAWSYAGSGGYRGGGGGTHSHLSDLTNTGGGGAGAAFIYCNTAVNQSTTGIITA